MHLHSPAARRLHSSLGAAGVLVVLASVSLATPAGAAAKPELAKGLYKGQIVDGDGDPESYAVAIRISAKKLRKNATAGRITYRATENEQTGANALDCRGTLKYRGRSGRTFRFVETMAGGDAAQCVSGGTVSLTRVSARRLTYRWTQAAMDRPAPTGTLAR